MHFLGSFPPWEDSLPPRKWPPAQLRGTPAGPSPPLCKPGLQGPGCRTPLPLGVAALFPARGQAAGAAGAAGATEPRTKRLSNFFASVMWTQLSFSTTLMCLTSSLNLGKAHAPQEPPSPSVRAHQECGGGGHRPGLGSHPRSCGHAPSTFAPQALHSTPAEPTPTACLSICGFPLLVWSPNSRSASKVSGPEAPRLSSIQTLPRSGFCSLPPLHWDCPPPFCPPTAW